MFVVLCICFTSISMISAYALQNDVLSEETTGITEGTTALQSEIPEITTVMIQDDDEDMELPTVPILTDQTSITQQTDTVDIQPTESEPAIESNSQKKSTIPHIETLPEEPTTCHHEEHLVVPMDVGSDSKVCPNHPKGPFQYSKAPDLPGRYDTVHKVKCLGNNGACFSYDYVPHSKRTSQYNATYHKSSCSKCGWYGLYSHSFIYNGGEIRCSVCGWVK